MQKLFADSANKLCNLGKMFNVLAFREKKGVHDLGRSHDKQVLHDE